MKPDAPAWITGIGMRCAVGDHAVQCCAALRANVCRHAGWKHLGVGDDKLVAAAARPDLGDRPWSEKAPELLELPLAEALFSAGLYEPDELVALARRSRLRVLLGVPGSTAGREQAESLDELSVTLAEDLLPEGIDTVELWARDQVAWLVATAEAVRLLAHEEADICLVGAVDSLLESGYLRRLMVEGRVKTPATPSGLIPGEAGAWLVIEAPASARARGARALARVGAIGRGRERQAHTPEAPITAAALSHALDTALGAECGRGVGVVIADLNGERWRFLEWALAEARCLGTLRPGWRLWHPADCIGDVGAAFGAVAACHATRALARGYAGGDEVLICASSYSGESAALVLQHAE